MYIITNLPLFLDFKIILLLEVSLQLMKVGSFGIFGPVSGETE